MAVTYGMSCDLQNGKRNARVSEMGSRRNKIAIEWNRATGKVHKIIKWQLSATESTSKTTLSRRDIEVQVQVILLLFACVHSIRQTSGNFGKWAHQLAKPRGARFGNIQKEFPKKRKTIDLTKCTEMTQMPGSITGSLYAVRYSEPFWTHTKLPLNWRKLENRKKNITEIIINHKGTRMVKDKEDNKNYNSFKRRTWKI